MIVPAAVKTAVSGFTPDENFTLLPLKSNESSFIYKWGVRLVHTDAEGKEQVGWVCLADQSCREQLQFMPLYSGRTSNATKHLKDVHGVGSDKYSAEVSRKRSRDEEIEELKRSGLIVQDPKRMRVLLETKRIVLNALPFRFCETNESRVVAEICMKDDFNSPVNAKMVNHSIVELYATAKTEVMALLRENDVHSSKMLTVVADFWTCKTQHKKYLGVRVYFISKDWKLKSILLGARPFDPSYGERSTTIRTPFRRWMVQLLEDFGLSTDNIFGGMSDSGPDVKWMLQSGFGLQWEWCIAHMSNAATKYACGLVNDKRTSKNPEMTDLIDRVCTTVRQVRDVEVLGDLFKSLCELEDEHGTTKLLDYKSHRFLGVTRVIKRVVEKWNQLTEWYRSYDKKMRADGKDPRPFQLEDDRLTLVQLLSLLDPITTLNEKSQGEECAQVDTLLHLYKLRLVTLNSARPLRDYRSPCDSPAHFATTELTPLITKTRKLLAAAFDQRFFSRYLDRTKIRQHPFIFEMQLLLTPPFKNIDANLGIVTRLCYAQRETSQAACQRMAEYVRDAVIGKARALMLGLAADEPIPTVVADTEQTGFSRDIVEMFGSITQQQLPDDVREGQVEEELQRWRAEPAAFAVVNDGKPESILQFWGRQEDTNNYKYLPKLARIIFACPSSSAQIERDFGSSGLMVRPQRSCLSSFNVEMASFLSCNRSYISIAQCQRIPKNEIANHIPSHVLVGALPDEDDDDGELESCLLTLFSSSNLDEEDEPM